MLGVLKHSQINLKYSHVLSRCKLKTFLVNNIVPGAVESIRLLTNVRGNSIMSRSHVFEWH